MGQNHAVSSESEITVTRLQARAEHISLLYLLIMKVVTLSLKLLDVISSLSISLFSTCSICESFYNHFRKIGEESIRTYAFEISILPTELTGKG